MVIFQGTGENFACRSRGSVYQDNNRLINSEICILRLNIISITVTADNTHKFSIGNKKVCYKYCIRQKSSGIAA